MAPAVCRPHILLGISGSVAAIKTAELAELLCALGEVRIVATDASRHFLSGLQLPPEVQHIHGGCLFVLLHKACI